jgi:hypothetical protein
MKKNIRSARPELLTRLDRITIWPIRALLAVTLWTGWTACASAAPSHAIINSNQVLVIDGKAVFPIGFTMPPPPDEKTPEGKNGIRELADAGATFLRTGGHLTKENIRREQKYLDAAARYGMHCLPYLRENADVTSDGREAQLRKLLAQYKDHPGLGAWKGDDEPEWGKKPVEPLVRAYEIIKEVDPNHPVVIIHAPRGTVESLRKYNGTGDIIGADIYPIGYPPGRHSTLTNKEISLVGDHTRILMEVAEGKKPVWMVLQISWSGVLQPGKTLRMPTFPEERFMTYEAIINGARGLLYFGGDNLKAMSEADQKLGWNWSFWKRVLRPVIEEIGSKGPLYPALVAPNSPSPIEVSGAPGLEYSARETGGDLFILACKPEGPTTEATFTGLPASVSKGEVLYEPPRYVEAKDGSFKDWFAPFEVHVYRFRKQP